MKGRIIPDRATADELVEAKDEPTQRLAKLLIQSRIPRTTVCTHWRETVIDSTNSAFRRGRASQDLQNHQPCGTARNAGASAAAKHARRPHWSRFATCRLEDQ